MRHQNYVQWICCRINHISGLIMKLQNITSGYAFSRNPIIVNESYPGDAFDKRGGAITIMLAGKNIYEGRFFPPLSMDISEIIDAYIPTLPELPEGNTEPVVEIYNSAAMADFSVIVNAQYDSYETERELLAIPGGVSRQNFRRFANLGRDAFASRFLNPKGNFFLTTRTSGWRVSMKETELYPLYFLNNPQATQLDIVEKVSGKSLSFRCLSRGVSALDVDALRRRFMERYMVLPNIFDVYITGALSCRIVVEMADISKERYRVKFRNSLGVFEIMELTGELTVSPEYEDADEAAFKRLDPVTGDFFTERERVERRRAITVQTGVKHPDEISFLMDMIASDEVYLLDLSALPVKVIPSVEELSYQPRPETPQTFAVKLSVADMETNIMQDIVSGYESLKPRVFSRHFSNQFS